MEPPIWLPIVSAGLGFLGLVYAYFMKVPKHAYDDEKKFRPLSGYIFRITAQGARDRIVISSIVGLIVSMPLFVWSIMG